MSWSIPCRTCGQVGYTACLTPAGNYRRASHVVRVRDNFPPSTPEETP